MRWWFAAAFAWGLMSASLASAAGPVVHLDSGKVRGVSADGIDHFLGIPFAAPPVRDLRWRAPQPPTPWAGVRAADAFGADCMQPHPPSPFPMPPVSEDCLYLNVWTPAHVTGHGAPVMVWIFGGGYKTGAGSWPPYDGARMARQGVVVVTFNHRLGNFGFFVHPALLAQQTREPIYNYGVMDQIAALKWVRRNIARFGGDPGNVTIFGESSGGYSVNFLLTSPAARGLFAKAIVESGGGGPGPRMVRFDQSQGGQPSALQADTAYVERLGLSHPTAAQLRALPADKLLDGSGRAMIDSRVLVEDPTTAFEEGRQAHVPYLIGANSYEANILRRSGVQTIWTAYASEHQRISALYDGYGTHDPDLVAAQFVTDVFMVSGARRYARLMSATGAPTWLYHFDHTSTARLVAGPGAPHGSEIGFVFGTYGLVEPVSAQNDALSTAVMGYWTQFAKTGDPNGGGRPLWPAYRASSDELMLFTNEGPVVRQGFHKARLDFVDSLGPADVRD